jgi:hypothetical protein
MRSHPPELRNSRLTALVKDELHGRRLALLAAAISEHEGASTGAGIGARAHDSSLYRRLRSLGPAPGVAS